MRILALLLILVGFAGCLDESPPTDSAVDSDGDGISDADELAQGTDPMKPDWPVPAPMSRVVVSVIDSAINPYHDHFQRNASIADEILNSMLDADGNPPVRVQLSTEGSYDERREADAEFWGSIASGQLYYFEGTTVMGITFGGNIIDGGSHGTATSAAVLDANPEAIVILTQGVGGASAEKWASTTPFVDILSESYGLYCGQPVLELAPGDSTAKNNKVAWDNGKVPVGAADNTPCPAMNDGTSGPPWVVGVSGDHPASPETSCREPVSGNFPDFTADFTQNLPRDRVTDEYGFTSGTSFSTPMTAGSFSKALLDVRRAWSHEGGIQDGALAVGPDGEKLTKISLRDAFNATATYFGFATTCGEPGSVPINPAAPWVQMGWGHVDGEVGVKAGQVILGLEPRPIRDAAAVAYQEAVYDYRWQAWGLVS